MRARGWLALAGTLAVVVAAPRGLRASPPPSPAPTPTPAPGPPLPPTQAGVEAWEDSNAYLSWAHDKDVRCIVGHDTWGRVYYSPEVVAWLQAGRPPEGLPDGATIVKAMYTKKTDTKPWGTATMVKYKSGSFDGWFWGSQYGFFPCISCHASADSREQTFADLGHIDGSVREDESWCLKSDAPQAAGALRAAPRPSVRLRHGATVAPDPDALPKPRATPDPAFVSTYAPGKAWPAPLPTPPAFPAVSAQPWLVEGPHGSDPFIHSGNCQGCHDGGKWLVFPKGQTQNMVVETAAETVNLSPYAEWSASMMGLSGRDPIFHAQLESEKALRPQLSAFLDDACYKCHGVMGQRQIGLERQQAFEHFMIYAQPGDPAFKYGALARDGISCTVCHRVSPAGLGTPESFTGAFQVGPATEVYGPFEDDVKTMPMRNALGITPRGGAQIKSSALCGSCHVVITPKAPSGTGAGIVSGADYPKAHEQTTYLEWLASGYQNERPPVDPERAKACHACHMPRTYEPVDGPQQELAFRIANIEDYRFPDPQPPNLLPRSELDLQVRKPFSRHTLVALNLTSMQLFQQFYGLLGVPAADTTGLDHQPPPPNLSNLLLAGRESRKLAERETARVELTSVARASGLLRAVVRVTNLAGHKLPSGVGFRRAFLEFRALDAQGQVLWASGATNALGVIVDGAGRPLESEFSTDPRAMQPHYEQIAREDQVQVYEERVLDDRGLLTTSFLSLFTDVKDNRLLPAGWPKGQAGLPEYLVAKLPRPAGNGSSGQFYSDPSYDDGSGSDTIVYTPPAERVPAGARLEATLYYQSIPPYYLRDRFATAAGAETQRLYWMASRLNLDGTPVEGWKLKVALASATAPQ